MQLDDLFDKQSIESIAKKTKLSPEIIAKLLSKEFEGLQKTQALGALSIIEREYGISLESLREECKSHFADHKLSGIIPASVAPLRKEGRTGSKIFMLLFLAAVIFGAWYFFADYYKEKIGSMVSQEGLLITPAELDENRAVEQAKPKEAQAETIMPEQKSAAINEGNFSTVETNSAQAATPLTEEAVADANKSEANAAQETNETNLTTETPLSYENITLMPLKTMWFRLVDLESKKQTKFMRSKKLEIDLKEHGWLFSTSGAAFSLIANGVIEEFADKKEHYFRFDRDGIHPISNSEFQKALR